MNPLSKTFRPKLNELVGGCRKLWEQNYAMEKHILPVPGKGGAKSSKELTELRLQNFKKKIPANTTGEATAKGIFKSFDKGDYFFHYTPVVRKTGVYKGKAGATETVGGPSFMKFNKKKGYHFEGFEEL